MTKIYANGAFTEEAWVRLEADETLPAHPFADGQRRKVSLARFLADPAAVIAAGDDAAVVIAAGEDVQQLEPHLGRLPRVLVEFPKFTDGRGFSAARILREQLGYAGDIRAIGDFILDQIPLMRRCGVSSFEIVKPQVEASLRAGEWPEVTHYLQPVGSVAEIPAGTRPWARRPSDLHKLDQAAE